MTSDQIQMVRDLLEDKIEHYREELWAARELDSNSRYSRIRERAEHNAAKYQPLLVAAQNTLAAFNQEHSEAN